jgi:hypothetical protein
VCSRLQVFLKLTMGQEFLDWKKISKTILKKLFFFTSSSFFLIWGFMSKNLKTGFSLR